MHVGALHSSLLLFAHAVPNFLLANASVIANKKL